MSKLLLILFLPISCLAQDISGKWCADYRSANNDGKLEDCIIFQKDNAKIEALRWTISQCSTCENPIERKPRISNMPISSKADSTIRVLSYLKLKLNNGKLIDPGNDPSGEDIVFTKVTNFKIRPSFNCSVAKQPREQSICENPNLSLLDLELSFVFNAAKQCNPKGRLDSLQNTWWKDELSKCQSGECVPALYSNRIDFLRKQCS